MRGRYSHEFLVALTAALFVAAHLVLAQPSLEDIDSINFALGVTSYDVARHQPHPPGYPIYIALGRLLSWALARVGEADPVACALVVQSGVAGGIAGWAAFRVLATMGTSPATALWTAVLWSCAPLVWLTAARPLSDMPGLAGALLAQWLLLRLAGGERRRRPALQAAATGVLTGVVVGMRSQVAWLAAPAALLALVRLWRHGERRLALTLIAGGLCGVAVWLVPMLVVTGGPGAYLAALDAQAGEDFEGVPMLATSFSPRLAVAALVETFVHPWGRWWVAAIVLVAALAGGVRLLRQQARPLWLLAVLYGPYAIFHLAFQETETTRYALPLVLPLLALAAAALTPLPAMRRIGLAGVAGHVALGVVAAVLLGTAASAHGLYRRLPVRAPEALAVLREAAAARPPDTVLMHRRVWAETRRVRQVVAAVPGLPDTVPRADEWRALAAVFDRPRLHAWWLVDPRRGDRVAIDPRALHHRATFGWPPPAAWLLGGMRPHRFDWYVVDQPAWMLRDGWALTPELAGITRATDAGPGHPDGAQALVRRRAAAQTVLVGGRLFSTDTADGPVVLDVSLGAWQRRTTIAPGAFHLVWQVPAAATDSPATAAAPAVRVEPLTVRATGGEEIGARLMLEQFDVQEVGVPVVALADGWQEPERDPATGRAWRWMSDAARLEVWGAPCPLRLHVRGTWPRHYDAAPVLTVRTAAGEVHRAPLARPFTIDVAIGAPTSGTAPLVVELESDRGFVAGEQTGTADARRLALEVAELRVAPSAGGRACSATR